MSQSDSPKDDRAALAEYRTVLAEKRTLFAELQLALLLVTLPLTIHTGLTVLARWHQIVARLHIMVPFWVALAAMLSSGLFIGSRALRRLRHVNRWLVVRPRPWEPG